MDMMLLRTIMSTVAITIAANLGLCFCGCAHAEYDINGECCPMCAPGNHVYWHCTIDTSTTCIPCPTSTYTDEPNGLLSCFPCTVCYPSNYNPSSSFIDILHLSLNTFTGTAFSDTVCVNCTYGTYSNGSLMACLPHSKCETMGLAEVKAGTMSSDAKCEKVTSVGLIVGVLIPVLVAVIVALSVCIRKYKARCSNEHGCCTTQRATEKDL